MTTVESFKYMDWIIVTINGWKLKPNAPGYVVTAYKKFNDLISMKITTGNKGHQRPHKSERKESGSV